MLLFLWGALRYPVHAKLVAKELQKQTKSGNSNKIEAYCDGTLVPEIRKGKRESQNSLFKSRNGKQSFEFKRPEF